MCYVHTPLALSRISKPEKKALVSKTLKLDRHRTTSIK